jgi:hypothetical protein
MLRLLLTSLLLLMCFHIPGSYAGEGTVTGRLTLDNGKPLADGQVFFFDAASKLDRPVLNKFWRVPDFVVQASETGDFAVVLPEGTYYLAAIKRMSDVLVGPPTDGDFFLPSHDKKDRYRSIQVMDGAITDIGTIKGITRYSSRRDAYKGKVTAIEGKLMRADGSPVGGMYVFAYTDSSMQGRPQFVSAQSNRDGSYRLLIDKGRILYLRTREGYAGGSPRPGVPIGVYGGVDGQKPVASRTNHVTGGIDIVVQPFAQRVN